MQSIPEAACPPSQALPEMTVVDMVWPEQSNHHDTLFGGAALAMLDRQAFIVASKALRGPVVTAAVSRLDFVAPAPLGQLVECRAGVVRRGRRSATVQTELISEDLLSGRRTRCLGGEFEMVSRLPAGEAAPPPSQGLWPALQDGAEHPVVRVAEIVFPGQANHRGVLHGGHAMEWLAKAGFVAATRCMRRVVVLASSSRMDFVAPAHVGDIVDVLAQVSQLGRRSVTVKLEMWAESPTGGSSQLCTSSSLVYVALDS